MATVYLADDLKHERKVALKVLKPELAALNTEGPLDTGTPQELFAGQWIPSFSGHQYDASPDGRRLLILRRNTGTVLPPSDEIIVVTNWFEELRQRMGN